MNKKTLILSLFLIVSGSLFAAKTSIEPATNDSIFPGFYLQEQPGSTSFEANQFPSTLKCYAGSEMKLDIHSLTQYNISAFSQSAYVIQKVVAGPSDSLSYTYEFVKKMDNEEQYRVRFQGKNAAQYNYGWMKSEAVLGDTLSFYRPNVDPLVTKQHSQRKRDLELAFLKKYNEAHVITPEFYALAYANIINEYVSSLYYFHRVYPLSLLPSNFFDDAILIENENSMYYYSALKSKFLFGLKYSPLKNIEEIYKNIQQEAPEFGKEYLLTNFISYYVASGDPSYKSFLDAVIAQNKKEIKNPEYVNYIKKVEQMYRKVGAVLPDSVLDNTFLYTMEEKKLPLRKVLDKYKGKALYIDFWASYCAPCRRNIRESKTASQYLKQQDVVEVYFSSDTNVESWKKALKDDAMEGAHYLKHEDRKSPLLNYFQISSIPHYVLMNSKHQVFMLDAPRPNDDAFSHLKDAIESMTKNKE